MLLMGVGDFGVSGHFGTENYVWKLCIIPKSLYEFWRFFLWFFGPKYLDTPPPHKRTHTHTHTHTHIHTHTHTHTHKHTHTQILLL